MSITEIPVKDRSIELTVISASHLKKVKTLGHQKSYVVVYIYTDHKFSSGVDSDGVNPTWNFHLTLNCADNFFSHHGTYLHFEIYSHGHFSNVLSGTLIGTVAIPLRDLNKDVKCHVEAELMSFQVRGPSGKPRGVLNLCIKLGDLHDKKIDGQLPSNAPQFTYRRVDQLPVDEAQLTAHYPEELTYASSEDEA